MAPNPQQGGAIDPRLLQAVQNLVAATNALQQTVSKVFPAWGGTTATSATGGAATLPADPVGFLQIVNPTTGATIKIPYYDP